MVLALLAGCSEDILDDGTITENTTEAEETEEEETVISEKEAADYVKKCRPLTEKYTSIIRNIDEFESVDFKVTAKVAQIMNNGKYYAYYDDSLNNEIIIVDNRTYDDTKIVEGDFIRIYGRFDGFTTMTRAINKVEEEIPTFVMYAADIADVFTMPGADGLSVDENGNIVEYNIGSETETTYNDEQQNSSSDSYDTESSNIKPEDLAGYYVGDQNNLDINIYSSPDGDEIGNWSYADDSGYIVAIEDGNYLLCGEYYTLVLAPKKEGGQIVVELWGETGGELWETLTMTEHYES